MNKLLNFINECRKRDFDDYQIKQALTSKGWPEDIVNDAFQILHEKSKKEKVDKYKNKVTIYLDNEILKNLEKRAKKNILNLHEQIEDILRRSVLSCKKGYPQPIKVDDKFIEIFSRERRGRKKK
jgi:hypothetical protein